MARRLIDISVPLQNDVPADPPGIHPAIQYIDHQQSLPRMLGFFAGLKAEELPDGQGWAMETVQLSTHNGTHLDAPYHYHPTMNRGERSWTIDEVPLEWCLQPAVKLDFRHLPDGYVATATDVEDELRRIGHRFHRSKSSSSTPAPEPNTVSRTMSIQVVAWVTKPRCTCWSAGAANRHRRLELGRAVRLHREKIRRDRERELDLGRPQGGTPHRLLPYREVAQSGTAALDRLHGLVLSWSRSSALRGWTPSGSHHRRMKP